MPRYPKAQRDVYSGEDVAGYVTAPATPGGGSGTVTTVSVATANGFSGSVSNPTTTPQITLQFNAPSGQILVGNGSNIATPVTMSGDATITNAGVVSVNKTRLIVRNETGVTIPTTRAVIVTGFNNYPLIGLADNTNEAKHNVIGITVGAIADQTNGYIATGGQCDAETNAWPVGTELYWTTSGNLTTTEPTSGEIKHIGIVTVQQNYPVGKILIYNQFEGSMRGAGAGIGLVDRLGDSAGATKVSWRNYANTEVASVDSLGRFTGSGAFLTNIPWSAMPFTPQAAYAILTTLGGLADAAGFLQNNGSGTLSWVSATGEPALGNPTVNAHSLGSTTAGTRSWASRPWVLWTKYTVTTLSNWTTAATIIGAAGTGKGTLTIPANTLQVGTIVRIRARGVYGTTTAAPTLNWTLVSGAVTICSSGALSMTTVSMSARPWELDLELECIATGGTSTIRANGWVRGMNTIAVNNTWPMTQNTAVSLDTTQNHTLDLTLACGTANAANTVSMYGCTIEIIPPPAA